MPAHWETLRLQWEYSHAASALLNLVAFIALVGDMVKPALKEFEHGLHTGDTGFEKAHGMGLFEYLEHNPGMAQFFSETMVGFHGREPPAVAEAYDFSGIGSLVDEKYWILSMPVRLDSITCTTEFSTVSAEAPG